MPEGQDPVAVATALRAEGYDAVEAGPGAIVPCRTDPERERPRVRAVIAAAPINLEDETSAGHEVRFRDEWGSRAAGKLPARRLASRGSLRQCHELLRALGGTSTA